MDPAKLVELIALPAGLFFLFLLFISGFLPWAVDGTSSVNGLGRGDAGVFAVLCLLVAAIIGLSYLFKGWLPVNAVIGAGFGVLAFFVMLGAVIQYGRFSGGGVILGLICTLFIGGAYITLALFRPLESPVFPTLSAPLLKRHGGLFLAIGSGAVLGILYLMFAAITPHAP
jgi:hypothetical protein